MTLAPDPDDLRQAADAIERGGLLLGPTDTVWGLACDARNDVAVRSLFSFKHRCSGKAMIVLVPDVETLQHLTGELPDGILEMIHDAERPLTVVYPQVSGGIADEVKAADGSVGIRVTSDPFCKELCRLTGTVLTSTSANLSDESAPAIYSEIAPEIVSGVDYVACWRRDDNSRSLPSRVVKIMPDLSIKVLRP